MGWALRKSKSKHKRFDKRTERGQGSSADQPELSVRKSPPTTTDGLVKM